jgi:hypothetical protein
MSSEHAQQGIDKAEGALRRIAVLEKRADSAERRWDTLLTALKEGGLSTWMIGAHLARGDLE